VRAAPADAAVRAFAWLGRLFLVLLLVVDQIGAPLHAHHHDFGVDGLRFAAVHDANIADDLHVESHSESGDGHSVLALRFEARTAVAAPEKTDTGKQAAFVALLLSEAAQLVDARPHARNWARYERRLYFTGVVRPQVRAPPLRA
tara:strand:+ start:84429 stop:84863 length:435 start_codon:yes stop_codon:yes gene_type:complete